MYGCLSCNTTFFLNIWFQFLRHGLNGTTGQNGVTFATVPLDIEIDNAREVYQKDKLISLNLLLNSEVNEIATEISEKHRAAHPQYAIVRVIVLHEI